MSHIVSRDPRPLFTRIDRVSIARRAPRRPPARFHLVTRLALLFTLPVAPVDARRPPRPAAGSIATEDIAIARRRARAEPIAWLPFAPAVFERARRERRFLLLDGAAEWCHWCHVMDETTYRDAEVRRILGERFLPMRVDVDARPDVADRYGEWGWPATIVFSPDGEELAKYRGYLPPDRFAALLAEVVQAPATSAGSSPATDETHALDRLPATPASLPWVVAQVVHDLDARYDAKEGSWGRRQKLAVGANVEMELRRAAHGDAAARARAAFTLEKQRALLDPVWGGIYQYSAGDDWRAPHFEKLMAYQAATIESYARASAVLGDAQRLAEARATAAYLDRFLAAPDGRYHANQDADVNAHDSGGPFVDGHVYYALDEAARMKRGVPWVDPHLYAGTTGVAVAALCVLHEVTGDATVLARARRAADAVLALQVEKDGAVLREEGKPGPRFLADAAAFGLAVARLSERTGEARYRDAALAIARAMVRDLDDPSTGTFFDRSVERDAAGVFARRRHPFQDNVKAARFLAALSRITGDESWRARARAALAGIADPRSLDEEGRMKGEFVLAADEAGALTWR